MVDAATSHPSWQSCRVLRSDVSGRSTEDNWGIAVEAPVQIAINGQPWLVMLASPINLEELALGLLITEAIISDSQAVSSIRVSEYLGEFRVDVDATSVVLSEELVRRRNIVTNSSCGLCGIESLAALHSAIPDSAEAWVTIEDHAIRAAVTQLPSLQPLGMKTRSVHAAAWCSVDGTIALVREDVGRHNALDKLIGALATSEATSDQYPKVGFVLMSSRCSYELVSKCRAVDAQALVSISAPTSMALAWGEALSIPIISVMRGGSNLDIVRFPSRSSVINHPNR